MFEQHSNKIYNSLQSKHAIYFSIQKNLSIIPLYRYAIVFLEPDNFNYPVLKKYYKSNN